MKRTGRMTAIASVLVPDLRPSTVSAALPGSWFGFALAELNVSDISSYGPAARQVKIHKSRPRLPIH